MTVDLEHFSSFSALAGGALIGVSVGWMLLVNGRIAGVSGLLGQVVTRIVGGPSADGWPVAAAFLVGLAAAPLAFAAFGHAPTIHLTSSASVLAVSGALVGLGTRIAGGCTSGHGVCGLANLSPRSLVATVTFMVTAMIVVAIGHSFT
jgi:uncharacterized membrane protein YedE/YeeE